LKKTKGFKKLENTRKERFQKKQTERQTRLEKLKVYCMKRTSEETEIERKSRLEKQKGYCKKEPQRKLRLREKPN